MAEFTENLNLELPAKTEQYNIAVQNSNMKKIDDFSKLTPPRALTADKLTSGVNINDVFFDGTEDIKITTGGGGLTMFAHIWSDHIYNDASYLRADTFSWHYASIYKTGYEHLLEQYNHEKSVQKTENGIIYRLTPDNFKIADASQQDAIRELYENTGSAWYYILDTENECFKLPREKAELGIHCPSTASTIVSDLNIYGNGMTLGITNGTTNEGLAYDTSTYPRLLTYSDSYGANIGGTREGKATGLGNVNVGITTDPENSGITGDGTGTTDLSGITTERISTDTKKYLYFYVGYYDREETEVAIGEISESLNNKVDLDGSNYIGSGLDKVIHEHCAGGFEIGDIGFTQMVIDETKGKRRALNNPSNYIIQEQYPELTKKIKATVELHPERACTNEEYGIAITMSTHGMCDKYVIDDEAGTIRLPKYPDYFIGGGNAPVVGNGMTLGLTNGTENAGLGLTGGSTSTEFNPYINNYGTPTGTATSGSKGTTFISYGITTDPTKSGIEAQLDNAELIKGTYFIQVATYSEIEDKIINEIELNNPFSLLDYKYSEYELNNISWLRSNGQFNSNAVYPAVYELLVKIYNGTETKAGVSVKLNTEEFTDYDFVINPQDNTFRLPIQVKLASGKAVVGNGMAMGVTDGTHLASLYQASYLSTIVTGYGATVPNKTTAVTDPIPVDTTVGVTTDPTKSGIETSDANLYLYFYVGETVQNANLVNVGRIEEKLSDKVDITNTEWAISACMPDYSAGFTLLINTVYTAEFDMLCIHKRDFSSPGGDDQFYIYEDDGATLIIHLEWRSFGGNYGMRTSSETIIIPKGTKFKFSTGSFTFYPLKGAK